MASFPLQTKIYSIEGAIGAGKSTVLTKLDQLCLPGVYCFLEPIDSWQNFSVESKDPPYQKETHNFLKKFYDYPGKDEGRQLQMVILSTMAERARKIQQIPDPKIVVVERSFHSARHIFLRSDAVMDPVDRSLMEYMTGVMEKTFESENERIYLSVSEQTMIERFMKRGRASENNLSLENLTQIRQYHEDYFRKTNCHIFNADHTSSLEIAKNIATLITQTGF